MARSMLPGRLLDPGSNAGARGMIALSGSSGETELGLQTRFRILFPSDHACRGDPSFAPPYQTLCRYQAVLNESGDPLRNGRSAMRPRKGRMIHLMDAFWEKTYYILGILLIFGRKITISRQEAHREF